MDTLDTVDVTDQSVNFIFKEFAIQSDATLTCKIWSFLSISSVFPRTLTYKTSQPYEVNAWWLLRQLDLCISSYIHLNLKIPKPPKLTLLFDKGKIRLYFEIIKRVASVSGSGKHNLAHTTHKGRRCRQRGWTRPERKHAIPTDSPTSRSQLVRNGTS